MGPLLDEKIIIFIQHWYYDMTTSESSSTSNKNRLHSTKQHPYHIVRLSLIKEKKKVSLPDQDSTASLKILMKSML